MILLAFLPGARTFSQSFDVIPTGFNSEGSDFAPVMFQNGVILCSNRNQKIHKMDEDSLQKYRTDLFFVQLNGIEAIGEPHLFSEELTTWLNEGPCVFYTSGQKMIYTGNIEPKNLRKGDKVKEYKLGLFFAEKNNGIWGNVIPFDHNTKDNKYNLAHPALSPDGQTLVFSSNMPGSLGKADLFMCRMTDGKWSLPMNMGPTINTKGNEFYPYFNAEGKLFFSSDGHHDTPDLDIYYTAKTDAGWRKPIALPKPINSPSDDFAMVMNAEGTLGFLSSNRKDGGLDNIYGINIDFPSFTDCGLNQKPKLCYVFEEKSVFDVDTLPLELQWDLGDGTKKIGNRIEHCYADSGLYRVKLNLLDTQSNQIYSEISSTEIRIVKPAQPYISCHNQLQTEVKEAFVVTGNSMVGFDLEEYYWEFGDGRKSKGLYTYHDYQTPGQYRVQVGAVSYPDISGKRHTSCSYKDVSVSENGVITMSEDENEYITMDSGRFKRNLPELNEGDSAAYYVLVKESQNRMPLNDPFFDRIEYEIRENIDSLLRKHRYTVGEGNTLSGVYSIFADLLTKGYDGVQVFGETFKTFEENTTHKGSFIAMDDTLAVNREFSKFANINFEYNSFEIMKISYSNLDYIISMLKVAPDYKINIRAHTDIIGGDEFNKKLSDKRAKSVVDYFAKNGIDKKRINWSGFGSSVPIADNETDEGRALNRRVEFELIENELTQAR